MTDNNDQKSILYIINHMDWFWSHRLPLAEGAKKKGYKVYVAAYNATNDKRLEENDFIPIDLPNPTQGPGPLAVLKTIFAIRKLLKSLPIGIVHTITLKYVFMTGLAAFGIKDKKLVFTVAGLGYLFSEVGMKPKILRTLIGPFLKLALKHPLASIICQNPDDMHLLISQSFVRKDNTHLIKGSGVDISNFSASSPEKTNTPLVLMPTRLLEDKGVAVFVEAARILKQKGVNANFQLAGGIDKINPLAYTENDMKSMTSDGAVTWLGRVNDMPSLLQKSTLIAYPSYYREGIPKVLLEAAACGKPIVTTDHPGCREVVNDNENGFLVPIKDPNKTAEAIEKILNNGDLPEKFGRNSRKRAEEEFDVNIIVEKTLKLYE